MQERNFARHKIICIPNRNTVHFQLLKKTWNNSDGGPVHARVPIHAHP